MIKKSLLLAWLGMAIVVMAQPDAVVRLEGIAIQGNSDEPGVMTITPWREAPGTERLQEPMKHYREPWLQPLSAGRLRQEMQQDKGLRRSAAENQ